MTDPIDAQIFKLQEKHDAPVDEKFVVFHREDWERRCQQQGLSLLPEQIIQDAVVIRRQDLAAPPILDAYAAFYQAHIEMLESLINDIPEYDVEFRERIDMCRVAADYFHEQAIAAWETDRKIPT